MRTSPRIATLVTCLLTASVTAAEPASGHEAEPAARGTAFEALEPGRWRLDAPTAASGLETTVGPEGVRIEVEAPGASGAFQLTALGLRRGDEFFPAAYTAPARRGERLELPRGPFVEWYAADPRGLEQGFDVSAPPSAPVAGEPLVVVFELRTELLATVTGDGRGVLFRTSTGEPALRVHSLVVRDADDRELAARIRVAPGSLEYVVDDHAARYPVVIDPIFGAADLSWYGPPHLNNDFGEGARGIGDVNGDGFSDFAYQGPSYGEVSVHYGSPGGALATPDVVLTGDSAGFGGSIAPAGDVNGDGVDDLFVGDLHYPVSTGGIIVGEGLLFLGSRSGIATTPAWTCLGEDQGVPTLYARAVAGIGDVNGDGYDDLAVGAPNYRAKLDGSAVGRAYVYLGGPNGPTTQPNWVYEGDPTYANNGVNYSQSFGYDVSGAGDVNGDGFDDLLVGMPHFCIDPDVTAFEGRGYVFHGSAENLATTPSWIVEGAHTNATHGFDVGRAGDVNGDGYADVLVGADIYWGGAGSSQGHVALYLGSASGLSTTESWSRTGTLENQRLGRVATAAGDLDGDGYSDVLVTSPYGNLQPSPGLAEVFHGSPAGLPAEPDWTSQGVQDQDYYGSAGGPAGDVNGDGYADLLVAAPLYDVLQPFSNEGRVDLFYGGPRLRLDAVPSWQVEPDADTAALGERALFAGDLNGDGFTDLVVAAPGADFAATDAGRVRVHYGAAGGPSATPDLVLDGAQAGEAFGTGLSGAGDVNGDGYDDLAIGAPGFDGGSGAVGRVVLHLGAATGLASTAAAQAVGDQPGAEFGTCVAAAGDVDGDGLADLFVGAPARDETFIDQGRGHVFLGSASAPLAGPAWSLDGASAGERFGAAAAAADVDADGFDDLVVGAPGFSGGEAGEGAAFLFAGSPGGPALLPSWSFEPDVAGASFGAALGRAGDVDADGHADLIAGAPDLASGGVAPGGVWLFLGASSGLSGAPAWTAVGGEDLGAFGSSVACAGDVDGDGHSDLLVGAPREDGSVLDGGRVHLFLGSASGPGVAAALVLEGDVAGARFGAAVAGEGDVDGDAVADVLAGAPARSSGQVDEGAAFLYRGSSAVVRAPRQQRADGVGLAATSIAVGGAPQAGTPTVLSLEARLPAGPRSVRMELEVKPAGVPFDGSAVLRSAEVFAGPLAGVFDRAEAAYGGLAEGAFHWRARLVSDDPWFPTTPWVSMPGRAPNETAFRMLDAGLGTRGSSTHGGTPGARTVTWTGN